MKIYLLHVLDNNLEYYEENCEEDTIVAAFDSEEKAKEAIKNFEVDLSWYDREYYPEEENIIVSDVIPEDLWDKNCDAHLNPKYVYNHRNLERTIFVYAVHKDSYKYKCKQLSHHMHYLGLYIKSMDLQ